MNSRFLSKVNFLVYSLCLVCEQRSGLGKVMFGARRFQTRREQTAKSPRTGETAPLDQYLITARVPIICTLVIA